MYKNKLKRNKDDFEKFVDEVKKRLKRCKVSKLAEHVVSTLPVFASHKPVVVEIHEVPEEFTPDEKPYKLEWKEWLEKEINISDKVLKISSLGIVDPLNKGDTLSKATKYFKDVTFTAFTKKPKKKKVKKEGDPTSPDGSGGEEGDEEVKKQDPVATAAKKSPKGKKGKIKLDQTFTSEIKPIATENDATPKGSEGAKPGAHKPKEDKPKDDTKSDNSEKSKPNTPKEEDEKKEEGDEKKEEE